MDRFRCAKVAGVFGIVGNIFLLIIKGIIGFFSKSQAMIADSLNSTGDIFSSFMTFIGNRISSIPRDDDHNLGHGKAEYIYSMLISIVMILTSLVIVKECFLTLIYNKRFVYSDWLVIVCIITIIVKFFLFLYTNMIGKKYNNLLVKANSKDHFNDCILTLCNLISCLFARIGFFIFDGIVGIVIGFWILLTALKIFRESYDVLMDKAISDDKKQQVYSIINAHEEIKRVRHFNSTPIGYMYQISLTIYVDGNLSTFESHEIADRLEKEIINNIDEIYLVVVHVNPI